MTWVLAGGLALLALVFVGVFGIYLWMRSYLRSDAFLEKVIARGETEFKAEVEAEGLAWEGSEIYAGRLVARGYEDAGFAEIDVAGLRTQIGKVDDGALMIPEIKASRFNIEFSPSRLKGRFPVEEGTGAGSEQPEPPAWLRKWLPSRAEIGLAHLSLGNLYVRDDNGIDKVALTGVEATAKPLTGGGAWEFDGRRGKLQLPSMPEMSVKDFTIRWRGDELFITEAAVTLLDGAELEGHGDITLGDEAGLNLLLNLANLDVTKVLDPQWNGKISGTLSGEVRVSGDPNSAEGLRHEGTLQLTGGVVEALPVLGKAATYTRNDQFKRLPLHRASVDFVHQGNRTEVTNIEIESSGLTRLEGTLVVDGDLLDGRLRLGVTPGTLRWIPGAEQKVFAVSDKGFLWTDVVVAGTKEQPSEDLSARLVGAAIETVVEEAPGKVLDAASEVIADPAKGVEKSRELLDTGREALETGTDVINSLVPLFR